MSFLGHVLFPSSNVFLVEQKRLWLSGAFKGLEAFLEHNRSDILKIVSVINPI